MELIEEKSTLLNQSAVKVLDIMEFLAESSEESLRLQDIATGLSMNESTVLRFLNALLKCGYAQQNPANRRYSLTMKVCSIANKVGAKNHISDIAMPVLKQISQVVQESVCLAIEQDMTVIYVCVVRGPDQMLRMMQRIGNRAPMHCTGVGKLLLSNHPEEEIDRMIAQKGLSVFTKNTLSTREALLREVKEAQQCGYALDNEECEVGARCIAVPIRDYTRSIVAGMSVTGTIFRMTDEKIRQFTPYLLEQAAILSSQLGYQP